MPRLFLKVIVLAGGVTSQSDAAFRLVDKTVMSLNTDVSKLPCARQGLCQASLFGDLTMLQPLTRLSKTHDDGWSLRH